MNILLATVRERSTRKHAAAEQLLAEYSGRVCHSVPCRVQAFATEEQFFAAFEKKSGRTPALLILLDSRGKAWSSEAFAAWLGKQRDGGTQHLVFAIGPANGWTRQAYEKAGLLLSLGPMTLPHELAAVLMAEQIYRAFTIIERHPYHLGHVSGAKG